jgi:hypothetical protein
MLQGNMTKPGHLNWRGKNSGSEDLAFGWPERRGGNRLGLGGSSRVEKRIQAIKTVDYFSGLSIQEKKRRTAGGLARAKAFPEFRLQRICLLGNMKYL